MKKLKLIMLFCIGAVFIASKSFGQANPYINVLPSNSGIVSVGGTIDITVTVGNTGPNSPIAQAKLRPIIVIPASVTFLANASQTGLPAGWTILSNTGSQLRLCNSSDAIPVNGVRTIILKATGVTVQAATAFSGNINFGNGTTCAAGTSVAGDLTTDNSASSTVEVVAASASISATGTPNNCAGQSNASINATAVGFTPNSWSLNPVAGVNGNNGTFTGLLGGTYTVSATDGSATATTVITLTDVNPLKTGTAAVTICANQLPYSWNGQSLTAGGTATFTTASLMTGCDSTTTLTLTVNPVKTATQAVTICANQLPYSWNGQSLTAAGTATFTTAASGTGCDSTTTLTLTVNPLKTATQAVTICANQLPYSWNGQSLTAAGTATFTTAASGTGCDSTTTLTLTVNPLKTGTAAATICANQLPYSWNGLSITSAGNSTFTTPSLMTGCDSTTTLTLTVNPLKTGTESATICASSLPYSWNGQSLTAGGTATFTTPSLMTGCDSTTTLTLTVNPLKTGTVAATICASSLPYSWNGQSLTTGGTATFTTPSLMTGCDSTTTLTLTVNPLISVNQNISILPAAFPYVWNGFTLTAAGSATFTTASLLTGCDSTTVLNLTINTSGITFSSSLSVDGNAVTAPLCNGGLVDLTIIPNGGIFPYTYSIDGTNFQSSNVFTGLSAGNYTVSVLDGLNILFSSAVTISQPAAITIASTTTNVNCKGYSSGSAAINISGGTAPYIILFDGQSIANNDVVSGLAAGTYEVLVLDANFCFVSSNVTITEPANMISATVTSTNNTCSNSNNATATVAVTNGAGTLSYAWSTMPVQTTATATGLAANSYDVLVTDANGCTTTASVTISEPGILGGAYAATNVLCNGALTGAVIFSATGGTTPYSYAWSNGATSKDLSGVAAGNYSVAVTDNNGCTAIVSLTITQPTAIVATSSVVNPLCNGGNGVVTIAATGGTGAYTGTGAQPAQPAGTYTYTVTDANLCTATVTAMITQPVAISFASANVVAPKCFGNSNGTIAVVGAGGNAPFTYSVSPSLLQVSIGSFSNVSAGSYAVTIKDANNCTFSSTVVVSQPAALVFAPIVLTSPTCHSTSTGAITASVNGGSGAITYSLIPNNGSQPIAGTFINLPSSIYQIKATDANGCNKVGAYPLVQPTQIKVTSVTKTNVKCNGGNDGSIVILSSGGVGARTLSSTPTATLLNPTTLTNLIATNYVVTVKDANNCSISTNVALTQPTPITWYPNVIFPSTTGNNGSIVVSATGGTGVKVYKLAPTTSVFGTSGSFLNLAAGSYTATASDINGCTTTQVIVLASASIVKGNAEGINVVETNNSLAIYPNPTVDYSTLSYDAAADQEATILVMDATGKTVKRIEVSLNKGNNLVQLDLKDLLTGTYKVMIIAADQKSTKQLLKL